MESFLSIDPTDKDTNSAKGLSWEGEISNLKPYVRIYLP